MITTLLYFIGGIAATLMLISSIWKYIMSKNPDIPTPYNVPLFGSLLHICRTPTEFAKQLMELALKNNHLYVLFYFHKPVIVSSKKEYAKIVLTSPKNIQKPFTYSYLHRWLGTGLLLSHGSKWKTRRRMLTHSFHFSILSHFSKIFEQSALTFIDRVKKHNSENQGPIEVQPLVSLTTLEAMCETSMGVKVNESSEGKMYIKYVACLNDLIMDRLFNPLITAFPDFIYGKTFNGKIFFNYLKYVHDFTISVINQRISSRQNNSTEANSIPEVNKNVNTEIHKTSCFIDTLLNSFQSGEIDVTGIREEVDTFVFEGHDTTSTALSFCLYCLGRYPKYQKEIQNEIKTAEGKDILEKVRNMKVLDYCIKEALRLYPPVPLYGRVLDEDVTIDGKNICKGTTIMLNAMMLHRNQNYWKNPLDFDPYRFAEESTKNQDSFCYVPFSAGPRNCIGQRFALFELKICLFYILQHFNIKSIQKDEDIEKTINVILKSQNGLHIQFEERSM